jgi:2'-5' RNA ligase
MPRLFFALWPDEQARESLAFQARALAMETGGREVPAARLHLTLAFLGAVESRSLALIRRAADTVSVESFQLIFDQVGAFRKAGVGWAGCSRPESRLLVLQSALEFALRSEGFPQEERPYSPHVTLVRRTATPADAKPISPVSWRVPTFALVETQRDTGRYVTLAEWRLRQVNT